jgi:hypothetical protein
MIQFWDILEHSIPHKISMLYFLLTSSSIKFIYSSVVDTVGLRVSTKQIKDFPAFIGSNVSKTLSTVEVYNSCKKHLSILYKFSMNPLEGTILFSLLFTLLFLLTVIIIVLFRFFVLYTFILLACLGLPAAGKHRNKEPELNWIIIINFNSDGDTR